MDGSPAAAIVPKWVVAVTKACGVTNLLTVALVAAAVALAARWLARQFYFVDFVRKPFAASGVPGAKAAPAPVAA